MLKILIGFLSVAGAVYIGQMLMDWFMSGRKNGIQDVKIVVRVKGEEKKLEYILRSLLSCTININTEAGAPEVIVVNSGLSDEAIEICSSLSIESGRLMVVDEEEVRNIT